jgi:hypothetical protein
MYDKFRLILRGFQNNAPRRRLKEKTSGRISRLFRRGRLHGLIKKAGRA